MVLNTANSIGLSQAELVVWLFVVYALGGAFNIFIALRYKLPFAGAHSVTAIAFLSTAAAAFTWSELTGSFIMAGCLIAILGLTGVFTPLLKHIPRPFIDAMLAGIILHFAIDMIPAFKDSPLIAGLAIAGFFAIPKLSKAIPPIAGALVLGVGALLLTYDFPNSASIPFELPPFTMPTFSMSGFISIALPVAVLILSNDLTVALASLKKNGYEKLPVNKTIVLSGLATACAGLLGGHSIHVGGMMSTICSSEDAGPKEKRYLAGLVSSVTVLLFGIFAWKIIVYMAMLPAFFITIITGLSLIGVLIGSLQSAFSAASYRYSVLLVFVIAISNVSFLGISAPVWSLLIGIAAAKLLGEGKSNEI
jgi:benzoate membrane transport protein